MTQPSPHKIRVLAVDDHPVILDGINFALQAESDMEVVAEGSTGELAIELFRQHRPDVTLMDLQMPGMSGIDALLIIRQEFPKARIIVITTYAGDIQAARALKAGAFGYLIKGTMRKELVDTIRRVHAGQRSVPHDVAASIAEHVVFDRLTEREIEVLRDAAAGNSNKRIGSDLGISEDTVKGHMSHIFEKLHANDRTHAVTIALKRGFFDG